MKKDVRVLEEQNVRVETGLVKFGNDWTGLFFRGDNAFPISIELENIINKKSLNENDITFLNSLKEIFSSVNES